MGSCKETTQLVSDGLDRELTTGERLRLRFHLLFCKHCANVDRQFSLIRTFMTRLGERAGEDLDRHATQAVPGDGRSSPRKSPGQGGEN